MLSQFGQEARVEGWMDRRVQPVSRSTGRLHGDVGMAFRDCGGPGGHRFSCAGGVVCDVGAGTVVLDALLSACRYILAGFLVLLQIFISPDPYLSLDRSGAADPGTDWRLPRWIPWASLAACVVAVAVDRHVTPAIVFAALLAIHPSRAIPGKPAPGLDTVFYDGHCALCHGSVRFLLAEDPDGEKFRFAPLQSPAFEAAVPVETRRDLPDSIVVRTASGGILDSLCCSANHLQRLGGYWRVLGTALNVIPSPAGDALYNLVAGNRYRIFGQQGDVCPLMPSTLRNRFDMGERTAGGR